MSEESARPAPPDPFTYSRNRSQFPLDELERYGDQWVAWSADGSRIVAHHVDLAEVTVQVKAAGLTSEDVNLEWIPPGGEVDTLL